MGKVFGDLTHSAVISPDGTVTWNASPQAAGKNLASAQSKELEPSSASVGDSGVSFNQPSKQFSQVAKPSFQQAAAMGSPAGTPNALSPGLTKGGKLAVLLMSGLQGALAGRGAQEQMAAQTGGRRAGGAGTAFQAGYQLPFTRAMQPLQLQQQQAETGLAQAGLQPVQTPYGNMPAALASKILTPYLGAQGRVQAAQTAGQYRLAGEQEQAQSRVQSAEIQKRFIPVPNVGLFDTQSRQVIPETQQGITVTPEIAADYQLPTQFIGKPMSLQNLAAVQRSSVFENMPQMTAQGPIVTNRRNATAKPVTGPNGERYSPPALASPREVGDPNNPGQTMNVPAGQSFGMPGVQSASVQAPRGVAKDFTSGQSSRSLNAIATAREHMKIFRSTAQDLNNGNVRAFNKLGNAISVQFGDDNVTNFNIAKQFFSGEVGKAVVAGGGTEGERSQLADAISTSSSWKQLQGALQTADNLLAGKQTALKQTYQSGMQGQPNFGQGVQPKRAGQQNTNDPLGIR